MRLKRTFVLLSLLVGMSVAQPAQAQCPMCRTAVESAKEIEGSKHGDGLNTGILYLLSLPYLTVAVVGGIWYSKRRKSKKDNAQ